MTRFDVDAANLASATAHLRARAVQLLPRGYRLLAIEPLARDGLELGASACFEDREGRVHRWDHVYPRHRTSTVESSPPSPGPFVETPEYRAIERFYGDRRARRSGVFLMNHIDEGLAVLEDLRASDRARRAFCLHPLVQADDDLARTYGDLAALTADPAVLVLALEYRHIANGALSSRELRSPDEIHLGPLAEVHDMLRADKVQNYKDFMLHHRATHSRSRALERYFELWLARLGVAPSALARWFELLQATPEPRTLDGVRS